MPFVMLLEGELDREHLENTFKTLIRRHESLRTSFHMIKEEPMQRIHAHVNFKIEFMDLEGNGDKDGNEVEKVIRGFIRSFDLTFAPLLRVGLFKQEQHLHLFIVDMHHIITDGTSIGLLIKEFVMSYANEKLNVLRIRYKDFSRWQDRLFHSEAFKQQEAYWLKQFAGDIPKLELPTDYPKPSKRTFTGSKIAFKINQDLTTLLNQLAADMESTLFIVLLAIHTILLSKYTGNYDIVVGTGIAGRRHADLQQVVGLFINMLAIRNQPNPDNTFLEFLQEVKDNAFNAYANQDYQYEELVNILNLQGDSVGNPLFETVLQMQNIEIPEFKIPGLTLKPFKFENQIARHDLVIYATERDDSIDMMMIYSTQLFLPSTSQVLANRFLEILEQVVKHPEIKIKDIIIFQELEKVAVDTLEKEKGDFEF
jgi:hypothetical protein